MEEVRSEANDEKQRITESFLKQLDKSEKRHQIELSRYTQDAKSKISQWDGATRRLQSDLHQAESLLEDEKIQKYIFEKKSDFNFVIGKLASHMKNAFHMFFFNNFQFFVSKRIF